MSQDSCWVAAALLHDGRVNGGLEIFFYFFLVGGEGWGVNSCKNKVTEMTQKHLRCVSMSVLL